MASLKDVAAHAGVSLTSASMILNTPDLAKRFNKNTVKRVRKSAQELNYYTDYRARSFRGGKTYLVGALIQDQEGSSALSQSYWGTLLAGVNGALYAHGYTLCLINSQENMLGSYEVGIRYLKEHRIDGLLATFLATEPCDQEDPEMSIIVLNPSYPKLDYPSVSYEIRSGVNEALQAIKTAGHERLAYFGPNQWWDDSVDNRPEVFLNGCKDFGLQGETFFFDWNIDHKSGASLIHCSRMKLEAMIAQGEFNHTVIICYNEECARGCYDVLLKQGKHIPEDVSVIAFDKCHDPFFYPKLATIDTKIFEMGYAAAELLVDQMQQGGKRVPSIILSTNYVPNESVGRPA